ncbi:MAG: hypothetical protein JW864_14755 [Spirochaetes bacterium]|nr:hypothetical protein [Spirochaetota bacterium]
MKKQENDLPILAFKSGNSLRKWLENNHESSKGIWVQIYKKNSGIESVTFEEVLDEGLCFGWSESKRRKFDTNSYLQRFTPRRVKGTTSKRNMEHIERLIKEKKMKPSGLRSFGIE